jgi:hypothetical protein
MNTVSAPSGNGAPVNTRTAWPGAIDPALLRARLETAGYRERALGIERQVVAPERVSIDGGVREGRHRNRRNQVPR